MIFEQPDSQVKLLGSLLQVLSKLQTDIAINNAFQHSIASILAPAKKPAQQPPCKDDVTTTEASLASLIPLRKTRSVTACQHTDKKHYAKVGGKSP